MTNAIPVFGGKWRNNSIAASNPPAEPPTPTIGQLKFFLGRLARDVCRVGLDRADFLRFDFARERGKPLFGVRFAAMVLFRLIAAARPNKLVIGVLPLFGRKPPFIKYFECQLCVSRALMEDARETLDRIFTKIRRNRSLETKLKWNLIIQKKKGLT